MQSIDVETGDIDIGPAGYDPVCEHAPESAPGQHTDGIEARRHEVPGELRRFADDRTQVGGEALRSAKELFHTDFRGDRHA